MKRAAASVPSSRRGASRGGRRRLTTVRLGARHSWVLALLVAACPGLKREAPRPPGRVVTGLAASNPAAEAKPIVGAPPWPGPAGPFVFVEGESFVTSGKSWEVLPSTGGGSNNERASGGSVLSGRSPREGQAFADVQIPSGGDYRIWVRLARRTDAHSAGNAIVVRVSQADSIRGELTADPEAGKPAEDAFAWVPLDATLAAGPARIVVEKDGTVCSHPSLRRLDCILLTTDRSYQPDFRDFGPQTYARVRVLAAEPHPANLVQLVQTSGGTRSSPVAGARRAGDTGAWMNISRLLRGESGAIYSVLDVSHADRVEFLVDFASAPRDADVTKTVKRVRAGNDAIAWLPPRPEVKRGPRTPEELAVERAAKVKLLPRIPFGRAPTSFPVTTAFQIPPEAMSSELPVLQYVGINGHDGVLDDTDRARGFVFSRLYQTAFHPGNPPFIRPDYDAVKAGMERFVRMLPPGLRGDQFLHLFLMDEASPAPLEKLAASEEAQAAFRRWLRDHHERPFAPGETADIRLTDSRSTPHPGLYFFSQRFRAATIVGYFRRVSGLAHSLYPAGIKTAQDFSDVPVFRGNMYANGNDYFDYYSEGALDVALSEDWTNAGATHELCGWNVALLRAATRAHGEPIQMSVIVAQRHPPLVGKLKASTDVAEGARALNLYDYGTKYAAPQETGWAETPELLPALGELAHEIGAVDDLLAGAKRLPSETAIFYSVPADIWNVGFDVAPGYERMGTYLALRHAQVPVDVLGDEQARSGLLGGYKAVFLPTEQLDHRNITSLSAWVHAGGTLVLGPGAGKRDEWNRATDALDLALSIRTAEAESSQRVPTAPSRSYCEGAKVSGAVQLSSDARVEVFGSGAPLSPPSKARILATFVDGRPAAFDVSRGRGRVVVLGFMPGLAYLCGARRAFAASDAKDPVPPLRSVAEGKVALGLVAGPADAIREPREAAYGELPFRYDPSLRTFIDEPALSASITRPVTADHAQVEATMLVGDRGWVIPLANYTGNPLGRVTLDVHAARRFRGIRSARGGALATESLPDGSIRISVPLESTDYLAAEWQ